MAFTAKVIIASKIETGAGDDRQAAVTFHADYADGRNKEWSRYTPSLSINVALKGSVADQLDVGKSYLLTFTEETPDSPTPAA